MFDRNDPADLLALKNEVNLDPNGYGYDPEQTNLVLDLINQKRPEITVSIDEVDSKEIISACTIEAYDGLLAPETAWFDLITRNETIKVTDQRKKELYGNGVATDSIWASADRDAMNAAMQALIEIAGSRAEQLFGYGTTISRDDWIAARDS